MEALPHGTVTFLFTDVEGSTRLWQQDTPRMSIALALHDTILRSVIEDHGGYVFSKAGDSFAAAFWRPTDAFEAAAEVQRALSRASWPESVVLRVRIGLHTGAAEERDGNYFGPDVNAAARIMAAGHGGQILLSPTTAAMISGIELIDHGEHRLRDLSRAIHLYEARLDGPGPGFAALRTVDAVPGNLPLQLSSFVGRDADVATVGQLVQGGRLVTLTGVGGVGKTRLALHTAAHVAEHFPDGVWLVELAPLGDPTAIPELVSAVVGVTVRTAGTALDDLVHALAHRRMLLLVDNCEHVLDAAALFIQAVLARTTTMKVLATSRESLRVPGEQVWPVPALESASSQSAAAQLFVQRAQAAAPSFSVSGSAADEAAVVEICQRLDGIALAIELAAARTVSLQPREILARLDNRFRLLSGRRGSERHQTLRQAVDWSYELLTESERRVLRGCSVFADGWNISAAVQVCGDDIFDDYMMLDVLDSLARKSLLTVNRTRGSTRYGMLETIRQYAGEQAEAHGELHILRQRHAVWFASEAERHQSMWDSAEQVISVDWVAAEFANLRTAFRWAAGHGIFQLATDIAFSTALICAPGLQRYEPAEWAEDILEPASASEISSLAELHLAASFCAHWGRSEDGLRYVHKAADLAGDNPSETLAVWIPLMEANAHSFAGRQTEHLAICREMLAREGQSRVVGLCGLCYGLSINGRADEARQIAAETLEAAKAYGNPFWLAFAFAAYGTAYASTDPQRALEALRRGLAHARAGRAPYWEAQIGIRIALVIASHGDADDALELLATAIDSFHRAGDIVSLAITFRTVASVLGRLGEPEIAASLYGAASPHIRSDGLRVLQELRHLLGQRTFEQHFVEGSRMELAEAVRFAKREVNRVRGRSAHSPAPRFADEAAPSS